MLQAFKNMFKRNNKKGKTIHLGTKEKLSMEEQVQNELGRPLTNPMPHNMGSQVNLLTKKQWRVLRSLHGSLGISRRETRKLLGQV